MNRGERLKCSAEAGIRGRVGERCPIFRTMGVIPYAHTVLVLSLPSWGPPWAPLALGVRPMSLSGLGSCRICLRPLALICRTLLPLEALSPLPAICSSDTPALPASRLLLWDLLCPELPDICTSSLLSTFTARLKCRLLREAFPSCCPVRSLYLHPALCPAWFSSASKVRPFPVDLFLVCTPGWDGTSRRAGALSPRGPRVPKLCPALSRHLTNAC